MIRGIEQLSYEEGRENWVYSVWKREGLGVTNCSSPVPAGAYKRDREGLLTRACGDRTQGNGFKLTKSRY